jgi:ABC-2 type transport system ATP-binding protein
MIQTEDLSKQFSDFLAVDGVNLNVQPGQVLALLGQNGAGKTTTVRMLTSLLAPTRGRALVAGMDVVAEPARVRAVVGVLTEQHGLYLRMSGSEYLDFYGRLYRLEDAVRKKRIRELFEYFGLMEFANQSIGKYSKGMRQKLALARSLIHEPPVLLLDEPTSAMDPESARLVRHAIGGLRSNNRTIVICTHNLVEAELLADHIAIIYKGRVLMQGTVDELRYDLLGSSEYEVRVRGEWKEKAFYLPKGATPSGESDHAFRFRIDDPVATNPELIKSIISAGVEVISMQEVPHTLEEIYLAAMAKVKDG